jgi:hypothetical protein
MSQAVIRYFGLTSSDGTLDKLTIIPLEGEGKVMDRVDLYVSGSSLLVDLERKLIGADPMQADEAVPRQLRMGRGSSSSGLHLPRHPLARSVPIPPSISARSNQTFVLITTCAFLHLFSQALPSQHISFTVSIHPATSRPLETQWPSLGSSMCLGSCRERRSIRKYSFWRCVRSFPFFSFSCVQIA